jgi:hypothetical protein
MQTGTPYSRVPEAVERYLSLRKAELRGRKPKPLRLIPLILKDNAPELFRRRQSLFSQFEHRETSFGYTIGFVRQVKPTKAHPKGRAVAGTFDVLVIAPQLVVISSTLEPDQHTQSPGLLARRAYPVARRPFFTSMILGRLVNNLAATNRLTPLCHDAHGYDRDTGDYRRDAKHQPIDDAMPVYGANTPLGRRTIV